MSGCFPVWSRLRQDALLYCSLGKPSFFFLQGGLLTFKELNTKRSNNMILTKPRCCTHALFRHLTSQETTAKVPLTLLRQTKSFVSPASLAESLLLSVTLTPFTTFLSCSSTMPLWPMSTEQQHLFTATHTRHAVPKGGWCPGSRLLHSLRASQLNSVRLHCV